MSAELKAAIESVGRTFEEFKSANDTRLKALEKNQGDVLDKIKVDEINNALGELITVKNQLIAVEAKVNRPGMGGSNGEQDQAKAEHRKAFNRFLRKGADNGLSDLEVQAALTTQSDPDGGYITPTEIDSEVTRVEGDIVAMRNLATIRAVGSATFKKIHNVGGTSSGWVGEAATRSETNTPVLKELEYPTMEVYAEPHATQSMLDDGMFDVDGWLASEIAIEFAEQEGTAFITGTGVKQPFGILSYTPVANANYSWGNLGFIVSGSAATIASVDPLITLVHSLKRGYRNGAAFLMNDLTLGAVRTLQDGAGNYVFQPGLAVDAPDMLLGKPVEIDDNMPDLGANAYSIAFGNFKRGYVITDRIGIRTLRDPFTAKPYVKFYTTKRVGGGVQDFAAIKLLKMST
jgi:HK97 family phage major capsid protein